MAGRASGRYKTEWWDDGMVLCLGQGENLHMAQPADATATHYSSSCSSKYKLVLPFWCRLIRVVPDKIQEGCKMVVYVCVCHITKPRFLVYCTWTLIQYNIHLIESWQNAT